MDEKSLQSHLKSGGMSGAYLIYGEEDYLKKYYIDKILKSVLDDALADFNLHKYDGESATLEQIIDASQMLPMMSSKLVVLVRDFDLSKLDKDESKLFEEFISDVPDTTVLIFWLDAVKFNEKKDSKWKKIVSLFAKHGNTLCIDKKDKNYLAKYAVGYAKKLGKELSDSDAYYLIDTVGDDLNVIKNEVEKITAFCLNEKIDRASIDAVAIKTVSVKAFDLTRAVSQNNLNRAFEILNLFFSQKMEPTVILSEIITAYVDMYRAKVSLSSGEKSDSLAEDFNYGNTAFRLRNGASYASKMSVEQIRECLNELDRADETIKSTAGDDRLALEQLLVKLAVISNR